VAVVDTQRLFLQAHPAVTCPTAHLPVKTVSDTNTTGTALVLVASTQAEVTLSTPAQTAAVTTP